MPLVNGLSRGVKCAQIAKSKGRKDSPLIVVDLKTNCIGWGRFVSRNTTHISSYFRQTTLTWLFQMLLIATGAISTKMLKRGNR